MSYPSINFKTTKRFPIPQERPWRDKIAVIGEFSKGPAEVVDITGDNFERFFGTDNTEGSVNVQQALEVGATNLSISRAVPEDSGSLSSIYIASGNTTGVEPVIGYEVDPGEFNPAINELSYTTGVSVDLSYIGSPIVNRTLISSVDTKKSELDHPSFTLVDEQASVIFTVVDFKAGVAVPTIKHDGTKFITVKTAATTAGDQQVVSIPKTVAGGTNDIDDVDQALQLGYVLKPDAGTEELLILSPPFSLSATHWGVLVESLTDTTAGDLAAVQVYDPVKDVYIMGYRVQLEQAAQLRARTVDSSYFTIPGFNYNNGFNLEELEGTFSFYNDQGGVYKEFKYQVVADAADQTDAFALTSEGFSTDPEEGIQLLFGNLGDTTNPVPLLKGGLFVVPLASGYITAGSDDAASDLAYGVGQSARAIVADLYNAFLASTTFSSVFEDVDLVTNFFPYGITFETSIKGLESTRLKYKLIRHLEGVGGTDLFFQVDGQEYVAEPPTDKVFMSGGFDGPKYGVRDFYALDGTPLVRVVALSPGAYNLRVTITPQSTISQKSSQFILNVEGLFAGQPTSEVLSLNTKSVDPNTGLFIQSADSSFVRVFYIPYLEFSASDIPSDRLDDLTAKLPVRIAPPLALYSASYAGNYSVSRSGANVLRNISLLGGADFANTSPPLSRNAIRKAAYMSAVKRLKGVDAAFVIITGIAYGDPFYADVFEEAVKQTAEADVETGLRQLFLETPAGMPAKQAEILADSINNRYVTLVNGRIVQQLAGGNFFRQASTLGYYAGLLATRSPQISVHSPLAGARLSSIVSANIKPDRQYKTSITDGRTDSIYFDSGLRTWKFLNGLTTSSEATDRYVSVNRIRIQIISDLYRNLQFIRSQSNTPALQSQVETSIGAYMQTKLQEGWLLQLGSVICNASNNSNSDIARGILNVEISYVPVIPADFINVNLIEDYTLIENLSLNVSN